MTMSFCIYNACTKIKLIIPTKHGHNTEHAIFSCMKAYCLSFYFDYTSDSHRRLKRNKYIEAN